MSLLFFGCMPITGGAFICMFCVQQKFCACLNQQGYAHKRTPVMIAIHGAGGNGRDMIGAFQVRNIRCCMWSCTRTCLITGTYCLPCIFSVLDVYKVCFQVMRVHTCAITDACHSGGSDTWLLST